MLLFEAQQIGKRPSSLAHCCRHTNLAIDFLSLLAAQMDQFEGVVLAATQCRVADVIEAIVSSTMTAPVLRLEFLFCPPSLMPGLKAERLQLYRLNASHLIQHQFGPSSFHHQYMYA